jgi:hypothetical protein
MAQLRARVPALMRARDRAAIEAWVQRSLPQTDANEAIMAP